MTRRHLSTPSLCLNLLPDTHKSESVQDGIANQARTAQVALLVLVLEPAVMPGTAPATGVQGRGPVPTGVLRRIHRKSICKFL